MLGVTFFGILFTPVFFYVIDAIASRKMLSTGWLPRAGAAALDVVTFGFLERSWAWLRDTASGWARRFQRKSTGVPTPHATPRKPSERPKHETAARRE
jgi:hypothetical protein